MIKGITVTLYNRKQTGVDGFNEPIYTEEPEAVSGVLVSPASSQEIINELNISGKKAVYTLAIPKGDKHDWENRRVDFFGQKWHTFGMVTEGIEANIPLKWNKKVQVERFATE